MSGGQNENQGQSKYSVYRQIRQQRTYRTLGRMTRLRVIIGFVLLLSVFFISGTVSKSFAARGDFRAKKFDRRQFFVPCALEKLSLSFIIAHDRKF